MNALLNAHTQRGQHGSPHVGPASNVLPKAQRSQTGVSSEYAEKENHEWFVLRVRYNRTQKAQRLISEANLQSYVPTHYVVKKENGKSKRILVRLLPNLIFVYTTRQVMSSLIRRQEDGTSLKYYLDKTKPLEDNGKHPPLTIPYTAMRNFIIATSTDSEHVRLVSAEQCRYKSGDIVKVIGGEFEGVVGKVSRIAGQQRVVVEVSGVCLVSTAYIPTAFLKKVR